MRYTNNGAIFWLTLYIDPRSGVHVLA